MHLYTRKIILQRVILCS